MRRALTSLQRHALPQRGNARTSLAEPITSQHGSVIRVTGDIATAALWQLIELPPPPPYMFYFSSS